MRVSAYHCSASTTRTTHLSVAVYNYIINKDIWGSSPFYLWVTTMKKLVLLFLFLIPNLTFAEECNCLPLPNSVNAMSNSANVMLVTVEEKERISIPAISENYKEYRIKVRVLKYWKGSAKQNMILRVPAAEIDCTTTLETGKSYLIYTLGGEMPLLTKCSRILDADTSRAADDILRLGSGQFPK